MSAMRIGAFERTVQKTEAWLADLNRELSWSDAHKSYKALRVTLHALRDRLPLAEAVQFGAQLPMLVRGFYYEGWRPAQTPDKSLDLSGFQIALEEAFRDEIDFDSERVCRAVFGVIERHISAGESRDIEASLPKSVRELWEQARAA